MITKDYINDTCLNQVLENIIERVEDSHLRNLYINEVSEYLDTLETVDSIYTENMFSDIKNSIQAGTSYIKQMSSSIKDTSDTINRTTKSLEKDIPELKHSVNRVMNDLETTQKDIRKTSRATVTMATLVSIALALVIINVMTKWYKKKLYGKCYRLRGDALTNCQLQVIGQTIKQLEENRSKCDSSTRPDLCRENIDTAINHYKRKEDDILTGGLIKRGLRKIRN